MPMTRPQRVQLAWTMYVVGLILLLWMIWSQRLYAWSGTAAGGTVTREFGMIRYLTITSEMSGPLGSATQKAIQSDWTWSRGAVASNAGISAAIALVLALICRRTINKDKLVGRCDECGYDLTGLHSDQCPECGARVGFARDPGR